MAVALLLAAVLAAGGAFAAVALTRHAAPVLRIHDHPGRAGSSSPDS